MLHPKAPGPRFVFVCLLIQLLVLCPSYPPQRRRLPLASSPTIGQAPSPERGWERAAGRHWPRLSMPNRQSPVPKAKVPGRTGPHAECFEGSGASIDEEMRRATGFGIWEPVSEARRREPMRPRLEAISGKAHSSSSSRWTPVASLSLS
jgi:hypothetical protein